MLLAVAVTAFVMVSTGMPAQATNSVASKRNDYNRDGVSDLLAINLGGTGCLWRWNGTGTGGIAAGQQVGCYWQVYNRVATPGDMNGDGVGDIFAYRSSDHCLVRWTGRGDGSFNSGSVIACRKVFSIYQVVDFWSIHGAGDFNDDGKADIGVIFKDTWDPQKHRTCWGFIPSTATGIMDVLVPGTCYDIDARDRFTGVGDLTGDGKSDIVALSGNCLYRYAHGPTGGLTAPVVLQCGYDWENLDELSGMGDLNRDGWGDLIATTTAGTIKRWYGDGQGNFGWAIPFGTPSWAPYRLTS